jgi:hypothetical protein
MTDLDKANLEAWERYERSQLEQLEYELEMEALRETQEQYDMYWEQQERLRDMAYEEYLTELGL